MGRPLSKSMIEKMNLVASGKTLSTQVGFSKYKVKDSDEIVMLSTEEDLDKGYVVLTINGKIVTKILRNVIQTVDGTIPYTIDENGKMVIDDVTIEPEVETASEEETVEETDEPETVEEETVEEETVEPETVEEESK